MSAISSDRLKQVFVKGLGVAPSSNFEGLAYGQNERWDSVAHMQLIFHLEKEFDIMLDPEDVVAISSYPTAIKILKKYGLEIG